MNPMFRILLPPLPMDISPSPTPTATWQLFMPVAGSGGAAPQAGVEAGTALGNWWAGMAALIALSALYALVRMRAGRKKA